MIFYENVDELQLLNDAIEAGGMAWWLMEYPSGAVFFHPNKIKMLGYTQNDMDAFVHYTSFTDLVHPDDHAAAMKSMMDHLTGKAEKYEVTYRIKTKDGAHIKFHDRGRIVARNKKGEVAVAGVVMDVTDGGPLSNNP